jgi:hypothetical protein
VSATPLLDFFRRGEVPRDVRMLAAQGILAPRAHEQVSILILLLDDADRDVRATAARTLDSLPLEPLQAFLGRSDVPIGVREFFGDRGVFPSTLPAIAGDAPLLDGEPADESADAVADDADHEQTTESLLQRIQKMGFTDRIKAAMRGSREMRALLIRDPNKMIAAAVLSSPKVSESEVESFARMASISEDVLRVIATNRAWLKNYGVVVALTRNPKTPVGLSLNLLSRLNDRDMAAVSVDRNVPEPLRQAARRKVVFGGRR